MLNEKMGKVAKSEKEKRKKEKRKKEKKCFRVRESDFSSF